MKIKRIILLALLLLAVFLFSSCEAVDELTGKGLWGWLGVDNPFDGGGETVTPEQTENGTTVAPVTTAPNKTQAPPITGGGAIKIPAYPTYQELLSKLNSDDLGGGAIMISCPTGSKVLTWSNAAMSNEIMASVKKSYNVNMFINPQSGEEITQNLTDAATNGGYSTDLLYIPLSTAAKYAKEGLLAPIDTHKLSSEKGRYDRDLMSGVMIDGNVYAISSSISSAYEANAVFYLNTDLLKRLDIEFDPYASVENGEWTWEMVYMICCAAKEKNDGSFTVSGSLWDKNKTFAMLYSSSGMQLSANDVYGDEKLDFSKESYPELLAEIAVFMGADGFMTEDEASLAFYNGELLLMTGTVGALRDYYTSLDSYAILPMPKVDSHQSEYKTVCDPDEVYVFAFPKNGKNNAVAFYLVDVMSYASKYCFKLDFIESLYSLYIRQSRSVAMLDIDAEARFVPRILTFGSDKLLEDAVEEFYGQ